MQCHFEPLTGEVVISSRAPPPPPAAKALVRRQKNSRGALAACTPVLVPDDVFTVVTDTQDMQHVLLQLPVRRLVGKAIAPSGMSFHDFSAQTRRHLQVRFGAGCWAAPRKAPTASLPAQRPPALRLTSPCC